MSESQAISGEEEISWFWEGMEADVRATLTAEQRIAIEKAMAKSGKKSGPADIRLHLGDYFIRIVAGKERRNKKRLKQDLKNNPLFAWKNVPILLVFTASWILSMVYIVAVISSVVQRFFFS
ncbi:hypothetical protein [Hyphococcus sp.]|uniref:hypothetical protein n=1 Tax=Hyphococcus sp. TaxID=2038636 RepID=UPI002689D886